MLNKKYHIEIITPLGVEDGLIDLSDDKKTIEINKGFALFDEFFISDNKITGYIKTEVPFTCNLTITGEISDSEINGYLHLDNYLTVQFKGKETDGKYIPGLR